MADDERQNMRADKVEVSSSLLTITGFTDEENAGLYKCKVTGYQKEITLNEESLAELGVYVETTSK